MEKLKMITYCENCEEMFAKVIFPKNIPSEVLKEEILRSYIELEKISSDCTCKKAKKKIKIGGVDVKLSGKPFVIGVDTFDGDDWFVGYFETNEEAITTAKQRGREMEKYHAYDKFGRWIGEGGIF